MKLAMELQKEEEVRAKVNRARSRYRNPNFVDYGSHESDYISAFNQHSHRRLSSSNNNNGGGGTNDDDDAPEYHPNINHGHNFYPTAVSSAMNASSSANEGDLNQIFERMRRAQMDDDIGDDHMAIFAHLANIHGHHSSFHRRRNSVNNGSWKRLPTRTLKEKDIDSLNKSEDKKSCPICITDFKKGDETRRLPCFHEFHRECVDKWFQQQNDKGNDASCPLDRKKIKEASQQQF
eukprot:189338_1